MKKWRENEMSWVNEIGYVDAQEFPLTVRVIQPAQFSFTRSFY